MGGTRRRSHIKRGPPTYWLACAFDRANALVVQRKEGSFMSHITKFVRSRRHPCLPWTCASCPPALPSCAHHIQPPPTIWSLSPPLRIPPPLGRPPSRPYTGSRRHLVCHHTFVCVSYRVDGHLVILMAGEARHEAWVGPRSDWPSSDRASSDAHPRRGFQGHRHSFPTARACAAPPAPAGAPKDTATHSSNPHEQHTTTTHMSNTQQHPT